MTDPAAVEQLLVRLVPDGTGVAACRVDGSLFQQLSEDERAFVGSARPVRQAEFAAGRSCAHRALATIGADAVTIGRGQRRQPVWPGGVTGSISHAAGLAAAAASPTTSSVAGLGIDVEVARGLDEDLWPQVLTPAERDACEASDDPGAVAAALFSAKEATFKALYPLLGAEIDFLEANAGLVGGAGTVSVPTLGASTAIRHGRAGSLVVSVAVVGTVR